MLAFLDIILEHSLCSYYSVDVVAEGYGVVGVFVRLIPYLFGDVRVELTDAGVVGADSIEHLTHLLFVKGRGFVETVLGELGKNFIVG